VGFGCDVGCMGGGEFSIFADSPMGATIVDGSTWEKSDDAKSFQPVTLTVGFFIKPSLNS